jgi:REP element-mobilizing transposase RayT
VGDDGVVEGRRLLRPSTPGAACCALLILWPRIMKYDPQRHHRRSIRLFGYDYSQPGAYFVTICTYNRELSLEAEQVEEIVRSAWASLPARFPHVVLDEFVIMPNHIHGIVILVPTTGAPLDSDTASRGAASSAPTLGRVIRAFKSLSAIEANRIMNRSERPFWQRNYYEHIIRDEDELDIIRQYIRDNPLRWDQDPDNPVNR